MLDVLIETVINRPRRQVAEYASNPDNAPRWYTNISSVEWLTSPPLRVGTRIEFVARFLRRRLAYTYEVIDYDPAVRLVMRTSEGPFPMETTYEWTDNSPERTRMSLRNRGLPRGFSRLIAPFMAVAVRSANRKDLELLKSLIEANSAGVP